MITSKEQFKDRYINEKVEEELMEFKDEINEKFQASALRSFKFPLMASPVEIKPEAFEYQPEIELI